MHQKMAMTMTGELVAVAPIEEMSAETMTKHIQNRHQEPFTAVGLSDPQVTARDRLVWDAYHRTEHRLYADHDHYHRGDEDGSSERGSDG